MNYLLEKAQTQFKSSGAIETANIQHFDMLKQSFTDEIKFANKELAFIQTSNDDVSEGASSRPPTTMIPRVLHPDLQRR